MRPFIFFCIIHLLHIPAWAQESPMISDLMVVPFSITENDGTLSVSWTESRIQSSFENFKVIQISDIRIDGIDLQIEYTIPKRDPDLSYTIGISIEASDSTLIDANIKEVNLNRNADKDGLNSLTWRNIIGDKVDPSENYTLLIRTDIFGDICTEAPILNVSKKLPYIAALVGGGILIGAGQLVKNQADDAYENYRQLWGDGSPQASSASLFNQLEKDQKTARALTYSGLGILFLDAAFYYLKTKNHRKAVKRYNTFCVGKKEIAIHPKYNSSSNMGFMLRINF